MKSYVIKKYLDNIGVDKNNPSHKTFDILVEYDGKIKWVSVPHDLYFTWAIKDSEKLEKYVENHMFENWEDVITDLTSLDYNWNKELKRYIDKVYPKRLFAILHEYNPESFNEESNNLFDDDDDDE
jgi:hypothetical protein